MLDKAFTQIYNINVKIYSYSYEEDEKMQSAPQKNMTLYLNATLTNEVIIEKFVHYVSFNIDSEYYDPVEKHDFWEMVYLESGKGYAYSDSEVHSLHPGDVYFHKPFEVHRFVAAPGSKCKIQIISFYGPENPLRRFENLKTTLTHQQVNLLKALKNEAINTFETICTNENRIFACLTHKSPPVFGGLQLCKIHLEHLLISIARNNTEKYTVENKFSKEYYETEIVRCITEIMAMNIYSELNIESICTQLNYGRTYLSNIFKKHHGISIMYYYNSLKILEAKRLITETDYPLTKISEILKFNNQFYFSKVFKKFEGMSPTEYRNSIKNTE